MTATDGRATPSRRELLVPMALLLLLGTLWGASFSLAKIATTSGIQPFGLILWQAGGGAVIVIVVCTLRRRRLPTNPRHLLYYLGCGMLGIVLPSTSIYVAAPHAPAGVLALLVASVPMVTYGLALATSLERFHPLRIAGLGVGLAGVLLIVGPEASLPDPDMAPWVVIGMGAPLCYAASNVFIARFRPPDTASLALASGMLTMAAAIVAPVAFATGSVHMIGAPWDAADLAVLLLPTVTGVAHIFVFEIIRRAGPVFFSQVGYLVTATGVLWGMLLFGERHSPWIWASLVLMCFGLALVNARRGAPSPPG